MKIKFLKQQNSYIFVANLYAFEYNKFQLYSQKSLFEQQSPAVYLLYNIAISDT